MDVLNLFNKVSFDDSVTKNQYHTYFPRIANYGKNDEIRISIQHQDVCTLPSESYIVISGKVEKPTEAAATFSLVRNAFSFLFEEIRFELNGVEVDKVRDVGVCTTIKGLLSLPASNEYVSDMAGWGRTGSLKTYFDGAGQRFFAHIPLKYLLGFAEDYRQIIVNARQEIILLRSGTDTNCYIGTAGAKIVIDEISWRVPHLEVNDEIK